MLVCVDSYGNLIGLGVRVDSNIGFMLTNFTYARKVRKEDVITLTYLGDGYYSDNYGRRLFETDSSFVGEGAGSTYASTIGDTVVKIGRCELRYIGELVVKIDRTDLHYFGNKLSRIGYTDLHYFGDKVSKIGNTDISYMGDKVWKINGKSIR